MHFVAVVFVVVNLLVLSTTTWITTATILYKETHILYTDRSIAYASSSEPGESGISTHQFEIPFGLVYLQWMPRTGHVWVRPIMELMGSVTSLRKNVVGGAQVPIVLFTSAAIWKGILKHPLWTAGHCFNLVLNVNAIFAGSGTSRIYSHFHLKPKIMLHSPFRTSLFLDSDTAWCKGNLAVLRSLGKQVDFAAVISPMEGPSIPRGIPRDFPGFNSGVFLFRTQRASVRTLLRRWETTYVKFWGKTHNDQLSLRRVLWDNVNSSSSSRLPKRLRLKIFYLPPRWNCRYKKFCVSSPSCFVLHIHGIKRMWAKRNYKQPIVERIPWEALNDKWGSWPSVYSKQAQAHISRNLSVLLPHGYN